MQVPILKIPFAEDNINFIQRCVKEVLKSGVLSMGKYTKLFEDKFKNLVQCKYGIATNSCTSALEIILRAIGVEANTVIVPTNTFAATAFSAIHAGAKVIFVDSMKDNFSIDPADLRKKIRADTKATILVHIGGIISPYIEEIKKVCSDQGIYLIEDCAHAHGCSYQGIPAGRWGIAGAFSFFPTKVFVSGEGGMIVTDNEDLYEKSIILRNHGKNPKLRNAITHLGSNWRISEFNAVIGVQQIDNAKWIIAERRRVAAFYDQHLRNLDGIKPLQFDSNLYSTYYKYICYLDKRINRRRLKKALKENYGVSLTGEVYDVPCHNESYFKNNRKWVVNGNENFPGADYIKRHHICLPCYPGLKEDELDYVVASIRQCLKETER